jgi:putative AbiEii toxin of type IV toxin-antitoxin system/SIR2-like protein
VEGPAVRVVRRKNALAIGALVLALLCAAAAWLWGRTTTYTAGPAGVSLDARAQSLAFAGDTLVVTQIDGWKVQRWRLDPGATTAPRSRVVDLAALTDRAPRAPLGTPRAETPSPKEIQSPVQQAAPPAQYPLNSAYAQQTVAPGPAVSIGPDGSTAAWILGRELFVSALDGDDEPFVGRLRASGCVPELGAAALVLACRDGRVEIREIRGRVRGEIQREAPWTLIRDRGSVLALSGADLFEIKNAAEPYTRINVDFGKYAHALARSDAGGVAVASSDGKVMLAFEGSRRVDLAAPGVADALAFLNAGSVLAGGSFRGIYLLTPGDEPEVFAPDIVGTRALAVRNGRVAYATADRVRIAPVVGTRSFGELGKILLGAAVFFALGGGVVFLWPAESKPAAAPPPIEPAGPPLQLPLPDPPAGLVTACLEGDCVLYAGAGLSAQAGYPTWQPFVEGLLTWSRDTGKVDPAFSESLQAALRAGQVDTVADALVSAIGRDDVMKRLEDTFGRPNKPSDAHRFLKRIPFCAALTTNFDSLLERTYQEAVQHVFTPRDAERLVEMLSRRAFFIGKLYGTLSVPDSVLFGPAEYAETVARNITFSQFMEGMFVSRTLFFVGASMEGIETYLSGLTFRGQMTRPHYALVAVTDAGYRAKADLLRRRYGIEVLPYTAAGPRFDEIPQFLEKVANLTLAGSEPTAAAARTGPTQGVRRIVLTNIGPFSELTLDLQPDWNVILGDNGVGKSSVLKALAACFCGTDAAPYGTRLVRRGEPSGSIVLETARNTYRMEIKIKSSGDAAVTVVPTRPLEVEGALALGFPALRAVSWDRPKGATSEGRQRATVEDLIPIVKGDPDPRLDRLKQWIVNLDSRINYERSRNGDDRYERLLARFFKIFDDVTPGMAIRFGHVNQDTREVTVVTDDGEIPIELISQGSVSLMGWIGILLQRLYEIHGDDEDPTRRYALVLIDEIDAHMHPEWQQTVVMDMTKIFPNVQFIATTHSPLVVGGMQGRQVTRFVRNQQGHAVSVEVKDDMLVGRADQILTSRLFGMKTTLDQQTQGAMETYKTLLGKKRTDAEDVEFHRLNKELKFKIPVAEETSPERKAFALVEAIVNDQIAGSVPEARKPLLEKARALLDELGGHDTRAV